jgi:chromosome segregation ATPase
VVLEGRILELEEQLNIRKSQQSESDRADINTLSDVLEGLQEELRAKDERIEVLEEQLGAVKSRDSWNTDRSGRHPAHIQKKLTEGSNFSGDKGSRIRELEAEVEGLRN